MLGFSRGKIVVIVFALLALSIGAVYVFSRERVAIVEPRFVALRNEVAELLKQISETPDTDLSALTGAEQRGEWEKASEASLSFAEKNDALAVLVAALIEKTNLLGAQAEMIGDAELRQEAREAIARLKDGNRAMGEYVELRGGVFRRLAAYYSGRAGGNAGADIAALEKDFSALDAMILSATTAYRAFNTAIAEFDAAARMRETP